MAETRQAGWTRYFCRRCNRSLSFDTRHHDTVTVNPTDPDLKFSHDRCGGKVWLSRRAAKF